MLFELHLLTTNLSFDFALICTENDEKKNDFALKMMKK